MSDRASEERERGRECPVCFDLDPPVRCENCGREPAERALRAALAVSPVRSGDTEEERGVG